LLFLLSGLNFLQGFYWFSLFAPLTDRGFGAIMKIPNFTADARNRIFAAFLCPFPCKNALLGLVLAGKGLKRRMCRNCPGTREGWALL
jgi:hypothetical protein